MFYLFAQWELPSEKQTFSSVTNIQCVELDCCHISYRIIYIRMYGVSRRFVFFMWRASRRVLFELMTDLWEYSVFIWSPKPRYCRQLHKCISKQHICDTRTNINSPFGKSVRSKGISQISSNQRANKKKREKRKKQKKQKHTETETEEKNVSEAIEKLDSKRLYCICSNAKLNRIYKKMGKQKVVLCNVRSI